MNRTLVFLLASAACLATQCMHKKASSPPPQDPSEQSSTEQLPSDGSVSTFVELSKLPIAPDRLERETGRTETTTSRPANTPDYRLGTGDVLDIVVWGEKEASGKFPVSRRGTITHLLAGEVEVAGKTPTEVTKQLETELGRDYFVNPRVTVTIAEYKSRRFTVWGEVREPRVYPLEADVTVLEAILAAGGLKETASDEIHLIRRRIDTDGDEDMEVIPISIKDLVSGKKASDNRLLQQNDLIIVRKFQGDATHGITVIGEVKKPDVYSLTDASTALTAIFKAGGFTEFANPNKAKLHRRAKDGKTQSISVRLGDAQRDKSLDVTLQAGDTISIPQTLF